MNIDIAENYEEMSQNAAKFIIEIIKENPNGLYCFAGGDTPVRTLELLVAAHQQSIIDLTKPYYIELDEWVGLDQNNPGSCLSYLNRNLFEPAGVPTAHIHCFDSLSSDLDNECKKANEYVKDHGGLVLTLLGVGQNGHLGFNEPGVDVNNNAHVVNLDDTTKTVGKKYFDTDIPLFKGITLGVKQFMESKVVLVEANGSKKVGPIKRVLDGDNDNMCPVTLMNSHPNAYLFIDKEARGE